MTKPRRISFSPLDAEHIYEWLQMYYFGAEQPYGGCHECAHLATRLERFIGPTEVRRINRLVKKNPGPLTPSR